MQHCRHISSLLHSQTNDISNVASASVSELRILWSFTYMFWTLSWSPNGTVCFPYMWTLWGWHALNKLVPETCTDARHVTSIVWFDWSVVFESFSYKKLARKRAVFCLVQLVSCTNFLSVCHCYYNSCVCVFVCIMLLRSSDVRWESDRSRWYPWWRRRSTGLSWWLHVHTNVHVCLRLPISASTRILRGLLYVLLSLSLSLAVHACMLLLAYAAMTLFFSDRKGATGISHVLAMYYVHSKHSSELRIVLAVCCTYNNTRLIFRCLLCILY